MIYLAMGMLKKDSGFGIAGVLVVAVCTVIIIGAGAYVFNRNHTKSTDVSNDTTPTSQQTPVENVTEPTVSYLEIPELGVRLKLVDVNSDAYYEVSEKASNTGKPNVYLSTRSLDAYEGCVANETSRGVAIMATFTEGYTDEVTGDFSKQYPDAPNIDGLYYYIEGNQYDCTDGKDEELYKSVKRAFIDSYSTIEKIPEGQE